MRLDLDMPVRCADRKFGALADIIIDPHTRQLTHLVVAPGDDHDEARLVAIEDAVGESSPGEISLVRTAAEVSALDRIQDSAFLALGQSPTGSSDWDVGIEMMYPLPQSGGLGPEMLGSGMAVDVNQRVAISYHRVPKGGVEIRRESPVTSSEGYHLGHVVGFILDEQKVIRHLVLEHGHLWGKRQVAIPGRAIERLQTDELTLNLASGDVDALEPIATHRFWS